MDNQEIKSEIRKDMLAKRDSLEKKYCEAAGDLLVDKLIIEGYLSKAMSPSSDAKNITVFTYVSTGSEVSTFPLIEFLLRFNVRVCVPKVIGSGEMQAWEIKSLDDLVLGKFGIYEPKTKNLCAEIPRNDGAWILAIIPGVAFDKKGYRIGYGGGYYDRYFSNLKNTKGIYKLGVCYDFQLVDKIPTDEHDIKMNQVLSLTF